MTEIRRLVRLVRTSGVAVPVGRFLVSLERGFAFGRRDGRAGFAIGRLRVTRGVF